MHLLQGLVAHCCRPHELLWAADAVALLQPLDTLFKLAAVKGVKLLNAKESDVVARVVDYGQLLVAAVFRP